MYGADTIHLLIAPLDLLQAVSLEQSPVEMWGHGTVKQEQAVRQCILHDDGVAFI